MVPTRFMELSEVNVTSASRESEAEIHDTKGAVPVGTVSYFAGII